MIMSTKYRFIQHNHSLCAHNMSLLNYVPNVPTCHDMLRANVPNFLTCQRAITCYVPTCLRAKFSYVPTCRRAKFLYVPTCHCMLRANMHSSCLPCANLPTCQFVVRSIRRQFLKFLGHPATNRFFLMLIFLRLPRVQLLNLLLEGLPNYLVRS